MEIREALQDVISKQRSTLVSRAYAKNDEKDMEALLDWLEEIYKDAEELMANAKG